MPIAVQMTTPGLESLLSVREGDGASTSVACTAETRRDVPMLRRRAGVRDCVPCGCGCGEETGLGSDPRGKRGMEVRGERRVWNREATEPLAGENREPQRILE